MPNYGIALIGRQRLGRHAAEIIIGRIVFANMVKTEAEIFPFPKPAHGRTELALRGASRMITARCRARAGYVLLGFRFNPDSIEERGIQIHDALL